MILSFIGMRVCSICCQDSTLARKWPRHFVSQIEGSFQQKKMSLSRSKRGQLHWQSLPRKNVSGRIQNFNRGQWTWQESKNIPSRDSIFYSWNGMTDMTLALWLWRMIINDDYSERVPVAPKPVRILLKILKSVKWEKACTNYKIYKYTVISVFMKLLHTGGHKTSKQSILLLQHLNGRRIHASQSDIQESCRLPESLWLLQRIHSPTNMPVTPQDAETIWNRHLISILPVRSKPSVVSCC